MKDPIVKTNPKENANIIQQKEDQYQYTYKIK